MVISEETHDKLTAFMQKAENDARRVLLKELDGKRVRFDAEDRKAILDPSGKFKIVGISDFYANTNHVGVIDVIISNDAGTWRREFCELDDGI